MNELRTEVKHKAGRGTEMYCPDRCQPRSHYLESRPAELPEQPGTENRLQQLEAADGAWFIKADNKAPCVDYLESSHI